MNRAINVPRLRFVVWFLLAFGLIQQGWSDNHAVTRKLVATNGQGYLETVNGYPVLHLKGTPEQMGFQHGALLGEAVRENIDFLFDKGLDEELKIGNLKVPKQMLAAMLNGTFTDKTPAGYLEEMRALAKGAGIPEQKVLGANFIPELFHCSGFALLKEATAESKLYHGRVLDYAVNWRLQEHAVLIITEPQGKIPFVNVSYAGFIGSVTGMNLEQVSIGEMGGGGVGQWNGVPMSFLVRMVLEQAHSLDEAIAVFQNNPRTCEYFYVIADAAENRAVGIRAIPTAVELIWPGREHPLLTKPVENTVLMSSGERYVNLAGLVRRGYGTFTQMTAIRLMDAPVAMKSNLHDVLMVPEDGILWVANAGKDGEPAWQQRYHRFDINELMASRPGNFQQDEKPVAAIAGDRRASQTAVLQD